MMVGCFSDGVQGYITLSMVGSWLAVFQIEMRAYLQGLDDGWLFFRWGSIFYYFLNGWMMVGCFSNEVQCSITSSMVG